MLFGETLLRQGQNDPALDQLFGRLGVGYAIPHFPLMV